LEEVDSKKYYRQEGMSRLNLSSRMSKRSPNCCDEEVISAHRNRTMMSMFCRWNLSWVFTGHDVRWSCPATKITGGFSQLLDALGHTTGVANWCSQRVEELHLQYEGLDIFNI